MFGIKTFIKKKFSLLNYFYSNTPADKFPEKMNSSFILTLRLYILENELRKDKNFKNLGNLLPYPNKEVIKVWHKLLPHNPNNLGNWSIADLNQNEIFGTRTFEREVVWKMIDLYNGDKKQLEGYLTSGGTEANIFSAWIGRKFLESKKIKKDKICLLKTSLTHYSITKASDVIGIKNFVVGLNEKNWGMDIDCLEKITITLYKKGFSGFLLPLTIGYTLTGNQDPYQKICLKVRELKKKLEEIEFFVWIDAALNGLVEPFVNNQFKPFSFPEIQTFLTDFHKFGFNPTPAGVILYRKNLRKLIEKPINYLKEKDNTLLGSRSGIPAVGSWLIIHRLGKVGYRKIIKKCLYEKEKMLKYIKKNFPKTMIVTNKSSLQALLIVKEKLPDKFCKKYGLNLFKMKIAFKNKIKLIKFYKFYFLQ